MDKRRFAAVLLATMMIGGSSASTLAQGEPTTPEGEDWQLGQYTSEGALTAVPEGVTATLLLEDGQATGNGGCNSFFGSYTLDGATITFDADMGRTEMFCEGDPQVVEDAYLATLPTVAAWTSDDTGLQLQDAEGTTVLTYGMATMSEMDLVLAAIAGLESQLAEMDSRIFDLESGATTDGGGATDGDGATDNETATATPKPLKKPAAPRVRGGKVETAFPDFFRDEFRPEAERKDNKNRETVRWRDRAANEDGYRVYARRGYCVLKPGVDPDGELNTNTYSDADSDFMLMRDAAERIRALPANTKQFRPKHEAISEALPEKPVSPYSNDEFYDVLVSAYNSTGESKKVLVGSYFLTPEFNCP
jgi:heat shock protein HslJ